MFLNIILLCLLIFGSIVSHEIRLDSKLILRWELLNPDAQNTEKLVKFSLILRNGMRGWAGIGWRRNPDQFYWPMADADFIICYANKPGEADPELGCIDAYLYTNKKIGADGETHWDTVMPIPAADTLPLVGGRNDIEFLPHESYRKEYSNDCITKWTFLRKVDTGDTNGDVDISGKNMKGIWAFHEKESKWEPNPKNWTDGARPDYHGNLNRGKFFFNVHPNKGKISDEL
jgi:hypothetical protein